MWTGEEIEDTARDMAALIRVFADERGGASEDADNAAAAILNHADLRCLALMLAATFHDLMTEYCRAHGFTGDELTARVGQQLDSIQADLLRQRAE